jgi:hypothetical protein
MTIILEQAGDGPVAAALAALVEAAAADGRAYTAARLGEMAAGAAGAYGAGLSEGLMDYLATGAWKGGEHASEIEGNASRGYGSEAARARDLAWLDGRIARAEALGSENAKKAKGHAASAAHYRTPAGIKEQRDEEAEYGMREGEIDYHPEFKARAARARRAAAEFAAEASRLRAVRARVASARAGK